MTWIRGQLGPSLLVVIIVFVSGPGAAQSRLSIGLISPSSRETARPYVDPFNRLVESRRLGRLEVESAELQNAESVVNATRRLVVKQVDLLVLPANATVTLAVLKMGNIGRTPLISLAVLTPDESALARREERQFVSFGFLPDRQEAFLGEAVEGSVARGDTAIVLGPTATVADELAKRIRAKATTASVEGKAFERSETFVSDLLSRRVSFIAGVLFEADAVGLGRALARSGRQTPMLIFAPPAPATRAYLAAKLVGQAVERGAQTGTRVLESIRQVPGFRAETQTIPLAWSLHALSLNSATYDKLAQARFYGPQGSADDTEECSCKNASGKPVECQQCPPGKCKKMNDGTDGCATSCE